MVGNCGVWTLLHGDHGACGDMAKVGWVGMHLAEHLVALLSLAFPPALLCPTSFMYGEKPRVFSFSI